MPGEPLIDQRIAQRMPRSRDGAQLAAILVFVPQAGRKGEIAGIQQRQQTDFRSVAFDPFRLAARRAELRGVDIRDADFLALEPERIAVDDAVHISVGAAQ